MPTRRSNGNGVRYVGWQCRLYPNQELASRFAGCRNAMRALANELLGAASQYYAETGVSMRRPQMNAFVKEWRHRKAEHSSYPASAAYRVGVDLDRALYEWRRKLKRQGRPAGFPKRKPPSRAPSIYFLSQGVMFKDDRVRLAKFGWVRWRGGMLPAHRLPQPHSLTRGLSSARLWRDAGDRWMLACMFRCGPIPRTPPRVRRAVVHSSMFEDQSNDRKAHRRRKRLERAAERSQPGSKRQARKQRAAALVARRLRNRKRDRIHKITSAAVRQADVVQGRGLVGESLHQLKYKTEWYGRELELE